MKNYIIIGIIAVIIIVVIIIVVKSNKNKSVLSEKGKDKSDNDLEAVKPISSSITYQNTFNEEPGSFYNTLAEMKLPVTYGSVDKGVYLLQGALNKIHKSGLKLDGVFGNATLYALVQNYQARSVDQKLFNQILREYK